MPREKAEKEHGISLTEQDVIQGAILTFRDAAGVRWVRMPDGTLSEQTRDAALESVRVALQVAIPESDHEPETLP